MAQDVDTPPDFRTQGEQLALGALSSKVLETQGKASQSWLADTLAKLVEWAISSASSIAITFATIIMRAEDRNAAAFQALTRTAIKDLTGADAGAGNRAIGATLLNSLAGGAGAGAGGALEPSATGAEAYMEIVMQLALEGYVEGGITSALSAGFLDKFTELDDILAQVLGLGRMSRRVMQPLMQAKVIEPFRWKVNKTYRPELLSPAEAARQFIRGRWTRERVVEELARQGWSDERIDAILNSQRRFLNPSDVRILVERQHWTGEQGRFHLRDQGYEEDLADDAMRLEGLKRIDQLETQEASALVAAYANREIDKGEFLSSLAAYVSLPTERALLQELAELRRTLNVRQLSVGDVRRLAVKRILSVVDFRRALEREGFAAVSVTALELELRFELDERKRIEEHRAELEAERLAEQQQREQERAARKAAVEAERALRRRGPLADLERAAVRGLVPFARVEEVLAPQYDPDTVEILVGLIEEDRQTYLAAQARAEEARKRAALRDVSVGELEQAVLAHVLTLEDFRRRLTFAGLDAGDVALLADVLAARQRDLEAATHKRAAAEEAATRRRIDLGRFERLVRLGARSLGQYDALLAELGFDEGSRAAMRELLERQIAEDRRADEQRAAGDARLRAKGLSLEQFRRAVVLGLKSDDAYQTFLLAEGFTADAIATLVADVRAAVADAEAARQRRRDAEARVEPRALPLATVARAARLGMLHPDVYQARLRAAGYAEEDVAIELELLLAEIADVQAARARRDALEREAQTRALSLAQVERAVKAGVSSVEDYRAQAITLGYGAADVATLIAVLEQELGATADAQQRHDAIDGELKARNLSLGQLEAAVTAGVQTIDWYHAEIRALGYGVDDAELLVALLITELEAAAAKVGS